MGFPVCSADKESACNAGDPSLIPGSGRCPGEAIGFPLQYSWAFLVAQTVKNPSAMWETWVQSLGWEDPLEEGMAIHSNTLAWRISMDRGAWLATVHGVGKILWRRGRQSTPVFLPGEFPWIEEPGRLQSTGSQGVGHD